LARGFAFLLFLELFLLALLECLCLARLLLARGDLLRREERRRRRRCGSGRGSGRFLDWRRDDFRLAGRRQRDFFDGGGRNRRRRSLVLTPHEHALLAHLDLDGARLAAGVCGLDLARLLARQRDALLRVTLGAVLLAQ